MASLRKNTRLGSWLLYAMATGISVSCAQTHPRDSVTPVEVAQPQQIESRTAPTRSIDESDVLHSELAENMSPESIERARTWGTGEAYEPRWWVREGLGSGVPNVPKFDEAVLDHEVAIVISGRPGCGAARGAAPRFEQVARDYSLPVAWIWESEGNYHWHRRLRLPMTTPVVFVLRDGEVRDLSIGNGTEGMRRLFERASGQVELRKPPQDFREKAEYRTAFDQIDFSGLDLTGIEFEVRINFSGSSFRGANLKGAVLRSASLFGADFVGANLAGVSADDRSVWTGAICPDGEPADSKANGTCLPSESLFESELNEAFGKPGTVYPAAPR